MKIIRITTVPSSLRTLLKGQLKFMSAHFEILGVSSEGPELEEVHQNEGIRVQAINMTRSITPFRDIVAAYKLFKLLKKEKPHIVHTHTPKAGTLGMLAARWAGVPNRLHTIAGMPLLEARGIKRMLLNTVERFTYNCATLVLPNSYGMKQIVKEAGFAKEEKLLVIGNGSSNGIDTDHFDPKLLTSETKERLKKELGIKETDVVFVFVGRMVKDKGVNELVMAFDMLSQTSENAKLILVGPHENHLDPLNAETEQRIASNEHIIAVGMQMDIRPYVGISDVLVLASYREGFPNVVLQGASMGLPCIVSDINGCNEIITHGENGLIVPPKDVEALKKAIYFYMENPLEIKKMGAGTRNKIIALYKREYLWKELLNLYRKLS